MILIPNILKRGLTLHQVRSLPIKKLFNRYYSDNVDNSKIDPSKKQVMVQGVSSEERLRVRRARPIDVTRVLKFVQKRASESWPAVPPAPHSVSHIILCDFVNRSLAQGHSMIAEQLDTRKGWTQICGLALAAAVCSWDAVMLERWSRCVRCNRSRRLMEFTAHCLKAPALHDKYNVHNILQVTLIVPQDCARRTEITCNLMKNTIQRGREMGFPLIRFDVTNDSMATLLDSLKLKREWELVFDSQTLQKQELKEGEVASIDNFIAVYSAVPEKFKVEDIPT